LHRWQGKNNCRDFERRETTRLIYPADRRPLLKIREHTLEVINISVKGLKFLNPLQRKIGTQVYGTIIMTTGKSIDIRGRIKWQKGNEMGLLASRISESVIIEEVRMLLRRDADEDDETASQPSRKKDEPTAIPIRKIGVVARVFWHYLNKDSKHTFLDADLVDATRWVMRFLNQDVIGQKIVLLEQEKLRTAGAVARMLKRRRYMAKTDKHKKTVAKIKSIRAYLSHPFWVNSELIRNTRRYLDRNVRKMTPETMEKLNAKVAKLKPYFDGTVLENSILASNNSLKQIAMDFCFTEIGICAKYGSPIVKDRNGNILCRFTDCGTPVCPFDSSKAHGAETAFLSGLERLLAAHPDSQTAA